MLETIPKERQQVAGKDSRGLKAAHMLDPFEEEKNGVR